TPLNAVDTPLGTVLVGVARDGWFNAAVGHQRVKINRVPAAGVDADGGDAKLVGDLDAFPGVLDGCADHFRLGVHEVLVRGNADQVDAVCEGETLEFVAIGAAGGIERRLFLEVHLPMENVHALDADRRGFLDHGFNRNFGRTEMPVRVGG